MKALLKFIQKELTLIKNSIQKSYDGAPPEFKKGIKNIFSVLIFLVIAFYAWTNGSKYYELKKMQADLVKGPHVKTFKVVNAPTTRVIKILGEAKPYASVTLYAKVSGYLKKVNVDKGDVVKTGQALAYIESPETEKALNAAAAAARNKKAIYQRIQKLLERDLVSAQEAETAKSESEIADAQFESQQAMSDYRTLRAPFDGTITARFADPGALVQNAMNSQSSSLPVLSISQVNRLRIYVYLDQRDALFVSKGTEVKIALTESPDLVFTGKVERVSGQLDEKTRMLLAEIDLDNKQGKIVAGSLVEVTLDLKTSAGLMVPSEALVLKDGKTVVPVIDNKNEVTYTEVKVGDNDGKNIKVLSGLNAGQVVALNLGNAIADHGKVRPIVEEAAGAK